MSVILRTGGRTSSDILSEPVPVTVSDWARSRQFPKQRMETAISAVLVIVMSVGQIYKVIKNMLMRAVHRRHPARKSRERMKKLREVLPKNGLRDVPSTRLICFEVTRCMAV